MFIRLLDNLLEVVLLSVQRVHSLFEIHLVCLNTFQLCLGHHQFTRLLLNVIL